MLLKGATGEMTISNWFTLRHIGIFSAVSKWGLSPWWPLLGLLYWYPITLFKSLKLTLVNPLWLSDTIWQHRFASTLARIKACCLTAPSHYLNQCWLIIKGALWHSPGSNLTIRAHELNLQHMFRNCAFKTRYVDGTPTSEVTPVTIRYIHPPHHGYP